MQKKISYYIVAYLRICVRNKGGTAGGLGPRSTRRERRETEKLQQAQPGLSYELSDQDAAGSLCREHAGFLREQGRLCEQDNKNRRIEAKNQETGARFPVRHHFLLPKI